MSNDPRNRSRSTRLAAAAAVVVMSLAVAACGGKQTAATKNRSDLRVGVASDVVDWDPHTSTTLGDQQVLENIYRGLTVLNPRTKLPEGELAESWTTSPDKLTWTFKLRPTAKFSTGAPVTANDVKYSIDRILNPATKATAASDFEEVKQVTGIGGGGQCKITNPGGRCCSRNYKPFIEKELKKHRRVRSV